ncbi:MAG: FliM/FliN family flagellar motor switch protein [Nitrospirae bacterium]|nr:FliM/FliN family flagellar motor switch protein [Nitrospirota bacterium]
MNAFTFISEASDNVSMLNKLYSKSGSLTFKFDEKQFVLLIRPVKEPFTPGVAARLSIDGNGVFVAVEKDVRLLRERIEGFAPGTDVFSLPSGLKEAVFEAVLEEILTAIERATGKKTLLAEAIADAAAPADAKFTVDLTALNPADTSMAMAGRVYLDPAGAALLGSFLDALPSVPEWDIGAVPVSCGVEIGQTTISTEDLTAIGPLDIIVFDEYYAGDNGNNVRVPVPGAGYITASVNNGTAQIMEIREANMAEGAAALNTQGIPVRLTFEIGTLDVTVSDLNSFKQGYVFTLATQADKPITIRANGKAIATGELVKIDNLVGVRVLDAGNEPIK